MGKITSAQIPGLFVQVAVKLPAKGGRPSFRACNSASQRSLGDKTSGRGGNEIDLQEGLQGKPQP